MNTPINIDELKAEYNPKLFNCQVGKWLDDMVYEKLKQDRKSLELFLEGDSINPFRQRTDISPSGLDKWAENAHKRVMESVDEYCLEQSLKIDEDIKYPSIYNLYRLHVTYKIGQLVYFKYPHSVYADAHTAVMKVAAKVGSYSYRLVPVTSGRYRESQLADFYQMHPF